MAKDKTRTRKLPEWLNSRQVHTVRVDASIGAYYQISFPNLVGWYDKYGDFRQGARVR